MQDQYTNPHAQPDGQDVDALLQDVRSILGESDDAIAGQADQLQPDDAAQEQMPEPEQEDAQPMTADDVQIDYGKFYEDSGSRDLFDCDDDAPAQTGPRPPLTYYEQSKPAYQRARRAAYEQQKQQARAARVQSQRQAERDELQKLRRGKPQPQRRSAEEYAQWLYEQGLSDKEQHARTEQELKLAETKGRRGRKNRKGGDGDAKSRKKRGPWRGILVLVLLLAMGAAAFHFVLARAPQGTASLGAHKSGCATILVAGTDEGGYRTDSMMLVSIDRGQKQVSLVSIPRDTLIYCEYSVPKINSAYGWAGGGESGMQELMLRVSEIIGFVPDGYVVVDLGVFEELVEMMGGIDFEVPVDMHYSDPSQGLEINLNAGMQHLSGNQAMQVARFRSGYATQDLGRIETQRALVSAAIRQWVSPKGLVHLPKALKLIEQSTNTNLTTANLLWLAESLLLCSRDEIAAATLPGTADYIAGGSYYVLDAAAVADTVNTYLNPYEEGVQASELYIRAG